MTVSVTQLAVALLLVWCDLPNYFASKFYWARCVFVVVRGGTIDLLLVLLVLCMLIAMMVQDAGVRFVLWMMIHILVQMRLKRHGAEIIAADSMDSSQQFIKGFRNRHTVHHNNIVVVVVAAAVDVVAAHVVVIVAI